MIESDHVYSDSIHRTIKVAVKPERLQKFLAKYGVASRRKIEEMIINGDITVNSQVAELGCKVTDKCKIVIAGRRFYVPDQNELEESSNKNPIKLIAYHKPVGQVSTSFDPEGRETVFDNLPKLHQARWISIGRLDINTSGLLLFTNDGNLANNLMHPSNNYDREYLVRVLGDVTSEKIKKLLKGIMLEDGMAKFKKISELNHEDSSSSKANKWFKVVLTEGRNREVRRLWEAVDCKVSRLSRIRFGPYQLPRALKPGKCQDLKIVRD